ncbi:MAG TPA: hypothetical protein VD866_08020 [Urbifossiella sp.]|nr:hypothetical protein [Urbifossiella sp.]
MTPTDFAPPDFTILAGAFAAGVGMLLGSAAILLLGHFHPTLRVAAAGVACAAAGSAAWVVAGSERAGWVGAVAAAAVLLVAAVGPGLVAALTRRPVVRWGGLAAAGLSFAVGAVAWYEYATDAAADRASQDLALLCDRPATHPAAARAVTDRGTAVAVMEATDPRAQAEAVAREGRFLDTPALRNKLIRRQPADERSNCHGWVFTGGRYWVGGLQVEHILSENGYAAVTTPQPGDLAIYRTDGEVVHTAIVRYVTPGMPVLVEGKWGATGVYLHDVDGSVYGTGYTYYRADRATHVLAGLDSAPVLAGGQ